MYIGLLGEKKTFVLFSWFVNFPLPEYVYIYIYIYIYMYKFSISFGKPFPFRKIVLNFNHPCEFGYKIHQLTYCSTIDLLTGIIVVNTFPLNEINIVVLKSMKQKCHYSKKQRCELILLYCYCSSSLLSS